jgi:anaerobic magnesium-protoporphyrin IX monomethyl ester cyclase
MRIALINPPFKTEFGKFSRASRSPAITKSGTLYYPIWLAYACGLLEKNGHEVLLLDSCADGLDLEDTTARVEAFHPELVVVDTSTPSIAEDVHCAVRLKETSTSPFVCLVGTHPSALPEEVMALDGRIDGIALREYDETLLCLANCMRDKGNIASVASLCYRKNGEVVHTGSRPFLQDLDAFPFVSQIYKKHLRIENYFFAAGEYPMVMIMTGRGCPSHCFFCVYPQTFHGHKYRLRSAGNVVDEFEYIARELPQVKSVGIEDDTFTADRTRVKEICQLLIERGIHKKLHWWANTRVSLDLETMTLMKAAGCRLIIPGFESGDQTILNNIKKGIKLDQSREYVANAEKAGLLVHGCFMVGNKGETRATMEKTLEFACATSPDTAQFFPLIPYPGTEAFEWAKENGHLTTLNYSKWLTEEGLHECVINLPGLSSAELVSFCNDARRKYYLRPRYLLRKLFQIILSAEERKRTMKSFKQFRKFLLH